MKDKSNRRKFIRNISIGSLSAGLLPTTLLEASEKQNPLKNNEDPENGFTPKRQYNGPYTGEYLNRIAFPCDDQ